MANTSNPFLPGQAPFNPNAQTPAANAPLPGGAPMPGGSAGAADEFEVDLTNVQAGFLIPNGLYKIRCIDVQQSVSNSGNPQFVWDFTVVDSEHAGHDFKLWTAITPAAMWKVAETVTALGVGQVGSVVKFKKTDVIGKECGAIVEEQEYKNNKRSVISKCITLADMQAMIANATQRK